MEGILRMSGKKQQVKIIFDSIAKRYDFLNHLLSFGFDYYWRKKALKLTGVDSSSILMDIACGTGDVSIEARKQGVEKIFGADYSYNMLRIFNNKSPWIKGRSIQMVAENIPFKESSVTNIAVAFGVRNFYNILRIFNNKSPWIKGRSIQMVAENIPFKESSVTNIAVAFGVRNFYNLPAG